MGDIDQIGELVVKRYLYNFDGRYVNYYKYERNNLKL